VAVAFFSGRPRTVQRKLDEATHLLQDRGATEAGVIRESPLTGSSLLRQLTDLGWTMDTMPYLSLKVNVPPSTVAQVVGEAQGISALGYFPGIIADPSFGMVRLLWWTETSTRDISPHTPAETVIPEVIHQLRSLARRSGGSVVVEHCPLSVKHQIDVWGDGPEGIEIMRRIKQQFDPQGILNPGRFVGRI
jgi:FAD/FMN-containing dehydrogenase